VRRGNPAKLKSCAATTDIKNLWIATGSALAMTVLGFIRVYLRSSVAKMIFYRVIGL
jgi:hypothetical protein